MNQCDHSDRDTFVLGIDLGTSSCKVCLMDMAGHVHDTSKHAYPTTIPQPGWAEQQPAAWIDAIHHAIMELTSKNAQNCLKIKAIALTSAAHIGVLLDEKHHVLRNAILWNDQRSASVAQSLNDQHGELIFKQTCQVASSSWTLAHLAWIKQHEPDTWQRVRHILLSKDYITWYMTGNHTTDPATAVSAQLYNIHTRNWSHELCTILGITPNMLPQIAAASQIVGTLKPDLAMQLGLPQGIAIVNGSLDSATELLAGGCCHVGQGMIRLATAGGLQIVVAHPTAHTHRITYPHVIEPCWYVQAGTNTCAAAVQWGIDRFCPGVQFAQAQALAGQAPAGCDGLLFHPYLAGERAPYWNPNLRGGFTGLSLSHETRHLLRAILEGTAMSIRDAMRTLDDVTLDNEPLMVVGGGAANQLWVQILANILNRPLLPLPEIDSSIGAAHMARHALNKHIPLADLTTPTQAKHHIILPQPELVEQYESQFQHYRQLAIEFNRT